MGVIGVVDSEESKEYCTAVKTGVTNDVTKYDPEEQSVEANDCDEEPFTFLEREHQRSE